MKERETSDSNEEIQKVTTRQYGSGDKMADIALYKHQAQPLVLHQLILHLTARQHVMNKIAPGFLKAMLESRDITKELDFTLGFTLCIHAFK